MEQSKGTLELARRPFRSLAALGRDRIVTLSLGVFPGLQIRVKSSVTAVVVIPSTHSGRPSAEHFIVVTSFSQQSHVRCRHEKGPQGDNLPTSTAGKLDIPRFTLLFLDLTAVSLDCHMFLKIKIIVLLWYLRGRYPNLQVFMSLHKVMQYLHSYIAYTSYALLFVPDRISLRSLSWTQTRNPSGELIQLKFLLVGPNSFVVSGEVGCI